MDLFLKIFQESLPSLLSGLRITVIMALLSLFFASIVGLIMCIFSISRFRLLKAISTTYIYVIRGIPLMILGLFLYFGVGAALQIRFDPMVAAIIALTINAGAYMAEIFRAGIQAIDFGQMEAARSLGLNYFKAMKRVILPQAVKIMIPSIMNQFITTIKDTSILSVVSVRELTLSGQIIIANNYRPFEVYAIVALMYFVFITILTMISKQMERKLSYDHRGE
ncbi:amino acid ABC transporter permease [Clostridium sp. KNHs216]|uniref:amino acid ABC transporter permease n=1 Tax=Clostridium sp. KNHs216 TaxID=1550235 RepID=UPI0011509CA4|nr:amino acid ABC transporter permease [Clostridium sp. KNHs216]TQI66638.1 polar amino acid transport system permease protein/polar amino acid transport system substrate-binding protein [Clostridium sp. KNHs216]